MKNRDSWRAFGYSKEDLDELTKSIRDHNVTYQQTKDNYEVLMTTIEKNGEKRLQIISQDIMQAKDM